MKKQRKFDSFVILIIAFAFLAGGCTTTHSENGVTIQQERSWNPLDYIPFF